jgi:hypothetical protein
VEHDVQQLQIDARKQLAQCEAQEPGTRNKPTLIETRRQRCRQARHQRYTKVHELHRGGHTQLEIAEKVGIGAETVSRSLNAPAFPERRITAEKMKECVWVRPEGLAQIQFLEWTGADHLRA